ncbi:MAG: cation-translocating P-type ATPase [Candidatus Promineifilaceae bacterium]
MSEWYQLPADEVLQKLESDPINGLSSAEAARRLEQFGPNELVEKGSKSPWLILWDQMKEPMVIVLIVAAVVSLLLNEFEDAIIILAIVILNAIIGFSQEYRAEQAIAALKQLSVPIVKVKRDGHTSEISARNLVPGDIVGLETGGKVPADGRLIEEVNLKIEEAALTGESEPVEKNIQPIPREDLAIGDRHNMVYMGTVATYGRGTAVITDTGMNTELGNIADLIQGVEEEMTPLQRRLAHLGKVLAVVALVIIAIVVILGWLRGEDLESLFLVGISMAVAAVPEGLPAVVSITLALGAQRMLARNALIRRLPAVETLGSVTVICSDKTGTLTQNRMTVKMLDVVGHSLEIDTLLNSKGFVLDAELDPAKPPRERTLSLLVKAGALCNDAFLEIDDEGQERYIGDPTEGALVKAAAELGYTKAELQDQFPRVGEVPFTSERKRMTTIHQASVDRPLLEEEWRDVPYVVFTKGAVDSLLDICTQIWTGEELLSIDEEMEQRIHEANKMHAQQGQRVLGVAFKALEALPEEINEETIEHDMIFVGLQSMIDPPRPEVRDAVITARQAGIRPVMITGDHPLTAQSIAADLTIAETDNVLTGRELAKMSSSELDAVVEDVSVYARVSPEHKLNIVNSLQDHHEVVAMTGDGVNDAPALKKADIGVAMGITGTDVSKEAADMVLLDDNFATIVAAVEEGRTIFDNIRKFIKYTLSSNTGELFVMLIAPFLGMPLPLVAVQILWINLVTDGLPGLALAVEDSEEGVMNRPPWSPDESIFSRGMGWRILWIGILMGLVSLGLGYIYYQENPDGVWQTMVFTTLVLAQMGNALAIRSNTESVFKIGLFSNRTMVIAITATAVLQLALIYVPFLQRFFNTKSLSPRDLVIALAASTVVFFAVEIEKWIRRVLKHREA